MDEFPLRALLRSIVVRRRVSFDDVEPRASSLNMQQQLSNSALLRPRLLLSLSFSPCGCVGCRPLLCCEEAAGGLLLTQFVMTLVARRYTSFGEGAQQLPNSLEAASFFTAEV